MKLTPAINFINILRASFSYEILAPKYTKLCFGFEIFWCQNIGKKSERKMLMTLTPGFLFLLSFFSLLLFLHLPPL